MGVTALEITDELAFTPLVLVPHRPLSRLINIIGPSSLKNRDGALFGRQYAITLPFSGFPAPIVPVRVVIKHDSFSFIKVVFESTLVFFTVGAIDAKTMAFA